MTVNKPLFDDAFFDDPQIRRVLEEAEAAGGTREEIDARIERRLLDLSSEMGAHLARQLKAGNARMLADRRSLRNAFMKRLRAHWGKAFDALKSLIEAGTESGSEFNEQYAPTAAREQDFLFDALRRLHGRACLIANEVLFLMEGGFASGSMARWRTLHELSVVAFFLKEHGPAVAERYLLHDRIESQKAAKQYQNYCERLGREPLPDEQLSLWQETRDGLIRRFGRAYGEDWGWAAEALGSSSASFVEIERAIDLDHMRPFFKLACYGNHAGGKGLRYDLGKALVPPGNELLLAGPSNAGFFDPGHCTAVSFFQVTTALLTHKSTLTSLVIVDALRRLVVELEEEFAQAEARLEARSKGQRH